MRWLVKPAHGGRGRSEAVLQSECDSHDCLTARSTCEFKVSGWIALDSGRGICNSLPALIGRRFDPIPMAIASSRLSIRKAAFRHPGPSISVGNLAGAMD